MVTIGYVPHKERLNLLLDYIIKIHMPKRSKFIYIKRFGAHPRIFFPMANQKPFAQQDSWCCFNDCDINYHIPGDTNPIGIGVYQKVYVRNIGFLDNVIILTFEIKNALHNPIKNMYIGFCTDCDIGNETGVMLMIYVMDSKKGDMW